MTEEKFDCYICNGDHYAKNCEVKETLRGPTTGLAIVRLLQAPQHSDKILETMKAVEACLSEMTGSGDAGL